MHTEHDIPLIAFIRSGGQTGADRGALDAARAAGVPLCGWVPAGGLAEDYPDPPGLLADYPELVESGRGDVAGYIERTELNVRDSHATLIVNPAGDQRRQLQGGTAMTADFADAYGRPLIVVTGWDKELIAPRLCSSLSGVGRGLTLNVAGPRASKNADAYRLTYELITELLQLNGHSGA
ncbi:MAG: putative molybdenum carrier protein [Actinomycetes bacterium]|jgi:hypothetical protein|nr:putative molybdenum carrier protein [Actinomycetes bacterium]